VSALGSARRRCELCGQRSVQATVLCGWGSGALDLDLRPPAGTRDTMRAWVQACPHCGYCARTITRARPGVAVVVALAAYARAAARTDVPALARDFGCVARLEAALGRPVAAGWAAVRAAWACDDAGVADGAAEFRTRALEAFDAARARCKRIVPRDPLERDVDAHRGRAEVVCADLARRAGQLARARAECDRGEARGPGTRVGTLLRFERHLVDAGDRAAHDADAACAWSLAEAFAAVGPVRTLGGGVLPPGPPPPPPGPRPSGARALIVWRDLLSMRLQHAMSARYGRRGWELLHARSWTPVEAVANGWAETPLEAEVLGELIGRRDQPTLAAAIEAMFEDSGEDWAGTYRERETFTADARRRWNDWLEFVASADDPDAAGDLEGAGDGYV
jgi:hypothetical protein